MKNTEKRLTRRSFLEKTLKTAGGIILFGGTSNILSSCGENFSEDKHYRFDLSGLEDWQAELFLKAGRDYWGVNEGRDDLSRNSSYFGNVSQPHTSETTSEIKNLTPLCNLLSDKMSPWSHVRVIARAYTSRNTLCDYDLHLDGVETECQDVYTFRIVFGQNETWVDCDNDSHPAGQDFYNVAAHEWGHIVGNDHSDNPNDIMYPIVPQRC